jgi:hypothetical protein
MKNKLSLILAVAFMLGSYLNAFGAGTCTQAITNFPTNTTTWQKVLTFTCTADAANATYPSTAISAANANNLKGWYLYKLITNPGSTAPTDNWDFTLSDGDGIDVLGGAGANRHTTTSQMIAPLLTTGVYFAQPVLDAWTLAITGNSVNSAVIVIQAIFVR